MRCRDSKKGSKKGDSDEGSSNGDAGGDEDAEDDEDDDTVWATDISAEAQAAREQEQLTAAAALLVQSAVRPQLTCETQLRK